MKVLDTTKPFHCGCTLKEKKESREGFAKGLLILPDKLCPEGAIIWKEFQLACDKLESEHKNTLWAWLEPEGKAVRKHFSAKNQIG